MFDCVLPTSTRNGQLITSYSVLNIRNALAKLQMIQLIQNVIAKYARITLKGYLNHLDKTNEMLGSILNSFHNNYYYQNLMQQILKLLKQIHSPS